MVSLLLLFFYVLLRDSHSSYQGGPIPKISRVGSIKRERERGDEGHLTCFTILSSCVVYVFDIFFSVFLGGLLPSFGVR